MNTDMPAHIVRNALSYDPVTGVFKWRKTTKHTKAGKVAGTTSNGYIAISINGTKYQAHRLAFLYITGSWPSHYIDHIDGNKSNNSFCNLREATKAENNRNVGHRRTNKFGVKGVRFESERGKWLARITVNRKIMNLGRFRTMEEAAAAYSEAAKNFHGEFARPA